MELNMDTFTEVIDNFLKENLIQAVITMPEGTEEVQIEDNTSAGPVIQFYILLNALGKVLDDLFAMKEVFDGDKKGELLKGCLGLVYNSCMEEKK